MKEDLRSVGSGNPVLVAATLLRPSLGNHNNIVVGMKEVEQAHSMHDAMDIQNNQVMVDGTIVLEKSVPTVVDKGKASYATMATKGSGVGEISLNGGNLQLIDLDNNYFLGVDAVPGTTVEVVNKHPSGANTIGRKSGQELKESRPAREVILNVAYVESNLGRKKKVASKGLEAINVVPIVNEQDVEVIPHTNAQQPEQHMKISIKENYDGNSTPEGEKIVKPHNYMGKGMKKGGKHEIQLRKPSEMRLPSKSSVKDWVQNLSQQLQEARHQSIVNNSDPVEEGLTTTTAQLILGGVASPVTDSKDLKVTIEVDSSA
ncbi:hypothetical protein V6N11_062077 [Hibiscus sabdariffa]|uniref:Uncharacterized protein n=1 Tax=Hibiscus sabdariffa TaxID=183260 RepID=A0ABR2PRX4_9ROSI